MNLLMAARTYAKSAFLAYGKKYKDLSQVQIEINDWNFNEMNERFDIHFQASYRYYNSGSLLLMGINSGFREETTDFNLKCDLDGGNSTIKAYNDSSWTKLGSIS